MSRPLLLVGGAVAVALLLVGATFLFKKSPEDHKGKDDRQADPLPYINYVPVRKDQRGKSGTTIYKKDKAFAGYNLYVQKPDTAAILVDMQGEIVHRWASDAGEPEHPLERWRGWRVARITPKGDLYASIDHSAVIKLDWASKLLWKADVPSHHEIVLADDGDVYTVAAELKIVPVGGHDRFIEDDVIDVLSPEDGKVKKKISFYELFSADEGLKKILEDLLNRRYAKFDRKGLEAIVKKKDAESLRRLGALMKDAKVDGLDAYDTMKLSRAFPGVPCDVFHANALVLLKDHPGGLWKDGDIMASFRYMNLIVVFDPAKNHVKWTWGPGEVYGQHEPSVLPNGNVLVYDNGTWRPGTRAQRGEGGGDEESGTAAKYSRILEVDPASKKVVWIYEASPRSAFYSPAEGGAQGLPNGDILAAEEGGRAFEVNHDKEIVWEYYNPKLDKSGKGRSGMYRIERLAPSMIEPLLAQKPAAPAAP